jgi:hypothetical protein
MNCTTCQTELSAFFDNELDHETHATIAQHIAACTSCHAALEELRALSRELEGTFATMRASAPTPPALLASAAPARRRMSLVNQLAAAAAVLVLGSLTWMSATGQLTNDGALTASEAEELLAAGTTALADLTSGQEFVVDVSTQETRRSFHFAKGQDGAYLWQPTMSPATSSPFDATRYLAGSDGRELWVSAPRAQRLPVDATRPPLPRRLALGLAALAQLDPSDTDSMQLSLDNTDPNTVWLRADARTPEGPITAWIQLDRHSGTALHYQLGVQPDESIDIALLHTSEPLDFRARTPLTPDLTATQAPLDDTPLSEALWQLGYTPGTTPPPEALESLRTTNSGYL